MKHLTTLGGDKIMLFHWRDQQFNHMIVGRPWLATLLQRARKQETTITKDADGHLTEAKCYACCVSAAIYMHLDIMLCSSMRYVKLKVGGGAGNQRGLECWRTILEEFDSHAYSAAQARWGSCSNPTQTQDISTLERLRRLD